MDTRLKSITFLTLILFLTSLFASLCSVSEQKPGKDGIIKEVNGIFRKLKSSGPSPGGGHRLENLQNLGLGGMKDSGPSPCCGHKLKKLQNLGNIKDSGPSPHGGRGLKTLQDLGVIKQSGPSPVYSSLLEKISKRMSPPEKLSEGKKFC